MGIARTPVNCSEAETRRAYQVVYWTNMARQTKDLPPLKVDGSLMNAAFVHARDMSEHEYFNHTDRTGGQPWDRAKSEGYCNYSALGENLALGHETPEKTVDGWMNSPHHRENLLSKDFREIGVGWASNGAEGAPYWVQELGTRRNIFPVIINNESYGTNTATVKLFLYGEGILTETRFSNDGENWTKWETFSSTRDWNLASGEGERTVYFEGRDEYGRVYRANDQIFLRELTQISNRNPR